ncbi:hypothetical protein PG996_012651 [Apiospora saccharicola]|uniref:DUF7924 domain-containing protein n=1 Tax=Apiospora saccharicola TaxID=335842 RepID=A0ABR1U384_9PEZI
MSFVRACVPGAGHPTHPVSVPVPDIVYGYTLKGPTAKLTRVQRITGDKLNPKMGEAIAGSLFFPFFIIEFKSDAGNRGVAENQCLGGSATCVAIMKNLNDLLGNYPGAPKVCDAAFSLVIDLRQAELFVSWMGDNEDDEEDKEEGDEEEEQEERESEEKEGVQKKCYMRRHKNFDLKEADQFLQFVSYIESIIDWGKGKRLREIQRALTFIRKEDRKRTLLEAKARKRSANPQPPKR